MRRLFLARGVCLTPLLAGMLAIGCRSATSTHVAPDPIKGGWETRHLRGVPITIKVPTHLEVRVVERRYFDPSDKTYAMPLTVAHRVETEVREKDEVFTVDAVRPAAGKLNYQSEFNKQYFKSFNSKVEDKTIEQITQSIGNLVGQVTKTAPKGKSVSANSALTADEAKLTYVDNLVGVRVFDVYMPGLDAAVQQFVAAMLPNVK